MKKSTLRRVVAEPTFETELALHRLDCMSSHRILDNYNHLEAFAEQVRSEPKLPPPLVTGRDLITRGVTPGPDMGKILRAAMDHQLENPDLNGEEMREWVRQHLLPEQG